jgi:hypothetical protein
MTHMNRVSHPLGALLLGLAALVFGPADRAFALATEHVGNNPVAPGAFGFSNEMLAAINVPGRVYWYEVNGNPTFYFKGNIRDLNDALKRFVAVAADKKEIILLPGKAESKTLTGEKTIAYDWALHVPMGLRWDKDPEIGDNRATLTIHIPTPRPAPLADTKQAKAWIAELDSDDFKVRERAAKGLEDLGASVCPVLREALKDNPPAETRQRIERLLGRHDGLELDQLELPKKDVPVIGLEKLLERNRKGLKSDDGDVRGWAVLGLVHRCAGADEVLPDLLKMLKTEKHEYALRCAASAIVHMGAAAKPALPELKEHLKSDDKNVKSAVQHAIDKIESEKDAAPAEEEVMKRQGIRKEIAEFVKARAEKKER